MKALGKRSPADRVGLSLLLFVGGLSLLNMLGRVRGNPDGSDFRFFWLAGRMWQAGGNPYGPAYRPFGIKLLGSWSPAMTWLYPPHFLFFNVPFSQPPMAVALLAWNLSGLALAIVAAGMLAQLFERTQAARLVAAVAMIAYLGLTTASGSALLVGQMAYLILFGVALIAWGIGRESRVAVAIGMAIVMLKPQVGLVLCCLIPFLRLGLSASAGGGLLVAAMSVPALAIGGIAATTSGFLHNIGGYRNIAYNFPTFMTGIANPIQALTGREMPPLPMTFAACAVCLIAIGYLRQGPWRDRPPEPRDAAATYLLLSLSAAAGLVSMHIYDLVILAPLVTLLPGLSFRRGILLIVPLAVVMRPENIAHLLGTGGAQIAAAGGLLLLVCGLILALRQQPRRLAPTELALAD